MLSFTQLGSLGRVGNQMFQYAALVGAAERTGHGFGVDREAFDLPRGFAIAAGDLDAPPLGRYRERQYHFDPGVLGVEDRTDLEGYFQSPRYFAHCPERVRTEYRFLPGIVARAESRLKAQRAPDTHLVAVHVRRGDYVANPDYHPLCSAQYYLRAMARVRRLAGGPCRFLVVSDDRAWCRASMQGPDLTILEPADVFDDLCLMTLCDHVIMANSTLSWWGAWLGAPGRVIVAPEQWFGPGYAGISTRDLYEAGWIRL